MRPLASAGRRPAELEPQVETTPVGMAPALRIVRLPLTDPRWARLVSGHPEGVVYQHPDWVRVLTAEYPADPLCLGCVDAAGELRGVLPLVPTRGLPLAGSVRTTRRLSSLPRTPVAGPLASDEAATAALLGAALDHTGRQRDVRLEIKAASPLPPAAVDRLRGVPWRLTYTLELPEDPNQLHFGDGRNHARIRWAVNKARRCGVRVRPAETEADLRAWYSIYLDTMRWHTVPPRPYRLFQAMWDILRPAGFMRLLLAEQENGGTTRLLAGSVFLMLGATVFYAFNGCRRDAMPLRANDVIQSEAIQAAVRHGFRHYDLGEVAESQDGLHEFKSKWGAAARRLIRYYDAGAHDIGVVEHKAPANPSLAAAAWRRVPSPVTALLGERLYRFL